MTWVLCLFIGMTIINVILNTARTLITVKGGMFLSALISAVAFGFYTVVTIVTVDAKSQVSIPILAIITAIVNFVGVYIVKYAEIRIRKDKLWLVEVVIFAKRLKSLRTYLNEQEIQFTELPIENSDNKFFRIYSNTQDESRKIKELLESFGAKYFVSESKHL